MADDDDPPVYCSVSGAARGAVGGNDDDPPVYRSLRATAQAMEAPVQEEVEGSLQDAELLAKMKELRVLGW